MLFRDALKVSSGGLRGDVLRALERGEKSCHTVQTSVSTFKRIVLRKNSHFVVTYHKKSKWSEAASV